MTVFLRSADCFAVLVKAVFRVCMFCLPAGYLFRDDPRLRIRVLRCPLRQSGFQCRQLLQVCHMRQQRRVQCRAGLPGFLTFLRCQRQTRPIALRVFPVTLQLFRKLLQCRKRRNQNACLLDCRLVPLRHTGNPVAFRCMNMFLCFAGQHTLLVIAVYGFQMGMGFFPADKVALRVAAAFQFHMKMRLPAAENPALQETVLRLFPGYHQAEQFFDSLRPAALYPVQGHPCTAGFPHLCAKLPQALIPVFRRFLVFRQPRRHLFPSGQGSKQFIYRFHGFIVPGAGFIVRSFSFGYRFLVPSFSFGYRFLVRSFSFGHRVLASAFSFRNGCRTSGRLHIAGASHGTLCFPAYQNRFTAFFRILVKAFTGLPVLLRRIAIVCMNMRFPFFGAAGQHAVFPIAVGVMDMAFLLIPAANQRAVFRTAYVPMDMAFLFLRLANQCILFPVAAVPMGMAFTLFRTANQCLNLLGLRVLFLSADNTVLIAVFIMDMHLFGRFPPYPRAFRAGHGRRTAGKYHAGRNQQAQTALQFLSHPSIFMEFHLFRPPFHSPRISSISWISSKTLLNTAS